ncbi:MAG TPA: hypothetical protein VFJ12_15600 [Segeticoccus sp.]|nr:hypothetical protein [Segeticoccus sp.]
MIVGLTNFIATIVAILLMDWVGRRGPLEDIEREIGGEELARAVRGDSGDSHDCDGSGRSTPNG